MRERAIDALAKTQDARAVEPIVDLMVRDEEAAPICARALGAIGDERAVDWLCEASVSGRADLEKEARAALKELGKGQLSPEARNQIKDFQLGNRKAPLTMRGLAAPRQDVPATGAGAPGQSGDLQRPPVGPADANRNDTLHANADGSSPGITDPAAAEANASPAQGALNLQNLEYGTLLLNRYKVIRKIGAGGFGSVYLVEDTAVREELILKVLNPQISMDRSIIRRFVLELKLTRRITHKNVIRLYDLLELGVGHAISMEYFPSTDLGRLIEREGALPVDRGLHIAEQICAGLAVAHGEGIIHRDIKPPNILVGDDQMVKIVDFGLASVAQHTGSRLTKSGILIGTPQYMAPEQISGDTVDSRTDVYSLGVLMYEMFSGVQPFRGDNPVNILFQHLEGEIPPLTEVAENIPAEINELVMRAMQRERDPRPADAQELLGLIEAIKT